MTILQKVIGFIQSYHQKSYIYCSFWIRVSLISADQRRFLNSSGTVFHKNSLLVFLEEEGVALQFNKLISISSNQRVCLNVVQCLGRKWSRRSTSDSWGSENAHWLTWTLGACELKRYNWYFSRCVKKRYIYDIWRRKKLVKKELQERIFFKVIRILWLYQTFD